MKIKALLIVLVLILSIAACKNNSLPDINPKKQFSIVGKWYTNPDDDRYYYQFYSDGTICRHYY